MQPSDKLKEQYMADAEAMASKPRFGYFSVLPSHTAAITDAHPPPPRRDSSGKVRTQARNVYSGTTSTGSLRKNYFSYTPSAFHGSPYLDPGKAERKAGVAEEKKWEGRETYKPARLNQTLTKAPYEYMSDADPQMKRVSRRAADGKVITQNANVLVSTQSKLDYLKNKEFRYTECPQKKEKQDEVQGQQEAFRTGSPHKELFTANSKIFFDADIKKRQQKKKQKLSITHDGAFRPSCISPGKDFTPVVYKQQGEGKAEVTAIKKQNKGQEPFRLTKIQHNSKPTPSISLSKVNLLRGYR